MSAQPEAKPSEAPLQFDRAVHADPSAAAELACARCEKPIAAAYYHDGNTTLCAECGTVRQLAAVPDRAAGTLVRAAAFGVGAAIVGALVYWGVMEYLELEIGIVAIAIGWLVGRAVARATRGRSARRHQVMAVGLTYFSVAMAYAPFAIKEWKNSDKSAAVASDSTATATVPTGSPPAPAAAAPATAATPVSPPAAGTTDDEVTAGGVAFALLMVSGLLLALPITAAVGSMPSGILSILIIGFGLRQAWTVSVASNSTVTGPHAIGGQAAA